MSKNIPEEMGAGMDKFCQRVEQMKRVYAKIAENARDDKSPDKVYRITDKKLLCEVLGAFAALDQKKAAANLTDIFEAGLHRETGALIISNKGATLFSLSPRTRTPYITRHIGMSVLVPGLGSEFVNVGLVGDTYTGRVVLRTESACTPSFVFGSQRCNCAHQWDSIRELAASFNRVEAPKLKSGHEFESWVQKQFEYNDGQHKPIQAGTGFLLMHIDTQNGMGSGFTPGEFVFDLFSRASIRHRGEYSSEQIAKTTMFGGFGAIGIPADPRKENNFAGYKVTFIVLDYLGTSRDIVFLTNNPLKMLQLENNGYKLKRIKTIGEVNLAGSQEAEQRSTEFHHHDISGKCVSFDAEFERIRSEISNLVGGN